MEEKDVFFNESDAHDFGVKKEVIKSFIGKRISHINLVDNEIIIVFVDDSALLIKDDGQSCCEHRYITCDDNLDDYELNKFLGIKIKKGPEITEGSGDIHETCFIDVLTDIGFFQFTTHNVHNGYYGGFNLYLDKN